jgi:hypothetical protein
MIRLWKHIIKPLVASIEARTILEVGAEFGLSTRVILNHVRSVSGHLHCIDPDPAFDAKTFQEENREHLTFYADLSLNVLDRIPRVDVALVDGDHNWYTVFNELQMIEENHQHDPLGMPLTFIHDINWPYGRRDLYYNPESIPNEFVHPYAQMGISIKDNTLVKKGGMNADLYNAIPYGGAKNGVMTAVEDYINQSSLDFHFVSIPLYFGLGILATSERLQASKDLAAHVERIEEMLSGTELIELGEYMRLTEGIAFQKIHRRMIAAEKRVSELEKKLSNSGVVAKEGV